MTSLDVITRFDKALDDVAQRFRGNRFADQFSYYISHVAEFAIIWQIIGLTVLLPIAERRNEWLRLALALLIESVLVNQVIKRITNRARPEPSTALTTTPRRPSTTSLPSGHASSAFTAATLLTASYSSLAPIWFTLAVVIASSRVHNRVHHASDIVAGMAVGTAIGLSALWLFPT